MERLRAVSITKRRRCHTWTQKEAYADFVAQATKMGELHSNLAKAAFKPAEQAIAAMQGTMQGTK
jgi:hypothetical protein